MEKTMNSIDRMRCAIRGEPTDHPPCILIVLGAACQLTGTKQSDYSTNPDVMARCLIDCARMTEGVDGIYVSRDNVVMHHQAMGGEVVFPDDAVGMKTGNVLETIRDFEKLGIPDFETAPGSSTVIEAARKVVEQVGDEYYVMANIDSGPFSTASSLRGIQNFMLDIVTEDEKLILDYLDFCCELVAAYGTAMQETGVKGIQIGESPSSLVGPELFEKYTLPFIKQSSKALYHENVDFWLHICGDSRHLLHHLTGDDLNLDVFELDSMVDLSDAYEITNGRIALKGNLDTMQLQNLTPKQVYEATSQMINDVGIDSPLIVSAGCEVPRNTPLENIIAMINTCKSFRL